MPAPNYFYRNYAIGRTHTGMLAYLCDLHNAGNTKPLRTLLDELGYADLKLPDVIGIQFEFKQADLGLFDGHHCFLLLEMKVDDREGLKMAIKRDAINLSHDWYKGLSEFAMGTMHRQATLYRHRAHRHNRWAQFATDNKTQKQPYRGIFEPGSAPEVLFVSLGVGEYGLLDFEDAEAKHIGLNRWTAAFAKTDELLCKCYSKALGAEQEFRKLATSPEAWLRETVEAVTWYTHRRSTKHPALLRLGILAERLEKRPNGWPPDLTYLPGVKSEGAGDPILQFNYIMYEQSSGYMPLFVELNSNGKLSFKLAAIQLGKKGSEVRQRIYQKIQEQLIKLSIADLHLCNRSAYVDANHRTVATVDVGLKRDIKLKAGLTIDSVVERIRTGLGVYAMAMVELRR